MKYFLNFTNLLSLTALTIAVCAAVFSVTGIGTLFAGASISAMVMASSLELGKLVGISFLYRYWADMPKGLRAYLCVACGILMLITSAGIYGYLSSAYAKVAATPLKMNAQVSILNNQVLTLDTEIKQRSARLAQIVSLQQQQENRVDNLINKSISGSSSSIKNAQTQLSELNATANKLQKEISDISHTRDSIKSLSIETDVSINTNSDIGTFVYISKAIGVSLDTVVKWFILIIVLVFDPLSVCLVLAYNFLIKHTTNKIQHPPATSNIIEQSISEPPTSIVNHSNPDINKFLDLNDQGTPEWMHPNFNWNDVTLWKDNPIAKLFKQHVIDKR